MISSVLTVAATLFIFLTQPLPVIQNFVESPDFDKLSLVDKYVLDLTLSGESQRSIAQICQLSKGSAFNAQRKIAKVIAEKS